MRLNTPEKGTEGIKALSHLHGLLPRLGFFVGNEGRIPYDYHDILATIAPRKVLVIAPTMDKDAILPDIAQCVDHARVIYNLHPEPDALQLFSPDDYSRFSPEMQQKSIDWLRDQVLPAKL